MAAESLSTTLLLAPSLIHYSPARPPSRGWTAAGLEETNMSAKKFVSSARKKRIPGRRPSQLAARKGSCQLRPFERMSDMLLVPWASSRVVRLPNMPPSPSAISLVCSTRLPRGAGTNDVCQTFENPPATCLSTLHCIFTIYTVHTKVV